MVCEVHREGWTALVLKSVIGGGRPSGGPSVGKSCLKSSSCRREKGPERRLPGLPFIRMRILEMHKHEKAKGSQIPNWPMSNDFQNSKITKAVKELKKALRSKPENLDPKWPQPLLRSRSIKHYQTY